MNPYLLQSVAVERARDLRNEVTAASRARKARGARAGTWPGTALSHAGVRLARRAAHL
jgi:hypothetical protein